MNLSFECNQNPKDMPTKHGTKFCKHCQKNVHDLRRKSPEKIDLFFETHPKPCVIIYEDQLAKVSFKHKVPKQTNRYFPYAATVIAVATLQHITIAQTSVKHTITIESNINKSDSNQKEEPKPNFVPSANQKYYIKGKLTITDKKLKRKRGRNLIFTFINNSKLEDTLAIGHLKSGGNFNIEVTKKVFDLFLILSGEINVDVKGLPRRAHIIEVNTIDNILEVKLSVRIKRVLMGKIAKPHF